ncbi:glycoside hydrolase family 26 protein [Desertivirga xinjiangensis]|uniref:glycoside hydrolase family 26 protein n=1 Tax=Desertivirga xinjiangensis TaxID=539206 RepID=UPI00210D4868|nr:glycosyl hydrolase [Pedobacter xinjiangensis]
MPISSINVLLITCCLCSYTACTYQKADLPGRQSAISDRYAAEEVKELLAFMETTIQKGTMIGHQDDLLYGNKWFADKNGSDIKRITGDYPAVTGWDFGNIETNADFNIDSVPFALIRERIAEAHARGIISTASWHADNPLTRGSYDDTTVGRPIDAILMDSIHRTVFYAWLDKLADFMLSLKDSNGRYIPLIFRPYMSHNKPGAYWWNSAQNSAGDFKKLWQATVTYLREKRNVHHILYAYSVYGTASSGELEDYYPGDEYVDIVGIDLFFDQPSDPDGQGYKSRLNESLSFLNGFSVKHKKVPSVTCTGMEGIRQANYFTDYLYPIFSQYKLSYILFWRNAWNDESHYYIPVPGHPASDNFVEFVNKPDVLLLGDIRQPGPV